MHLRPATGASRALSAAVGLTLLAGGALGWMGFRALLERERSIHTHHTSTTVLVRDRLLAEVARLESEVGRDLTRAARGLRTSRAARAWLAQLVTRHQWIRHPVLVDGAGGLAGLDLEAGWPPGEGLPASDAAFAALIDQAETTEFARRDLGAALRQYDAAIRRADAPAERALAQMRAARVLYKLGRYDEGLDRYRAVSHIDASLVDANGVPYAVSALRQTIDGLASLRRTEDRLKAERQLRNLVLEHPWDVSAGYEHHLSVALSLEGARDPEPAPAVLARQNALARFAWIRRDVLPRLSADLKGLQTDGSPRRVAAMRDGRPALVGWVVASGTDAPPVAVTYELRASHIAGPLLQEVLDMVDLGAELSVTVLDGTGAGLSDAPGATGTVVPLAEAPLDLPSGSRVALFDRRGRSIQQLVARERFIYGTLIAGMVLVLLAGITFTARASAREAELARLRTDFVASVSHELKTPLALIRMFGETLDGPIPVDEPQRREFYGVIRRESERLTHLIDNVLGLARIDAGTKQYSLAQTDLAQLTRDAVEAYRPFLEREGFAIDVDLPPHAILALVDRDSVIQALINLFQNAIKYSGNVKRVTVSAVEAGGYARLSVSDRGVGIPPRDISRIFDKYYRVPSTDQTAAAGSGLGLALVKHTMQAHGGHVDVESAPGAGSVFTLVFPVAVPSSMGA
jgi:signal transduction histidine kinase